MPGMYKTFGNNAEKKLPSPKKGSLKRISKKIPVMPWKKNKKQDKIADDIDISVTTLTSTDALDLESLSTLHEAKKQEQAVEPDEGGFNNNLGSRFLKEIMEELQKMQICLLSYVLFYLSLKDAVDLHRAMMTKMKQMVATTHYTD
eukprot:3504195-Ditylum_brightwellii.AAC.1